MSSSVYAKQLLSGSTNGRHIAVVSTASPGVLIHVPPNIANIMDEVWLYAHNNGSNASTLYTLWGGSLTADLGQVTLSGTSGRTLVGDGRIFSQSGSITAYVSAGTVIVDGYVNRVTPAAIDPRVLDWAVRVVRNGGAVPSISTQKALSTFMQSISQTGVCSKIVSMVCHVPDSLIAATTPLVPGPGFDPWTNNNFVSGDLNIHGLLSDGTAAGATGTKSLNTGIIPGSTAMTSTSAGMTVYVYDDPRLISSGYAIGVGGSAFDSQFALIPSVNSGGIPVNTSAYVWRFSGAPDSVVTANVMPPGYMSFSRTSSTVATLYTGSSVYAHRAVASISGTAQNGSIEPTFAIVAHAINALGSVSAWSNRRLSFIAIHTGLTFADSANFFNAIQALRYTLGGGYV